jgi:hypothetical protein
VKIVPVQIPGFPFWHWRYPDPRSAAIIIPQAPALPYTRKSSPGGMLAWMKKPPTSLR